MMSFSDSKGSDGGIFVGSDYYAAHSDSNVNRFNGSSQVSASRSSRVFQKVALLLLAGSTVILSTVVFSVGKGKETRGVEVEVGHNMWK